MNAQDYIVLLIVGIIIIVLVSRRIRYNHRVSPYNDFNLLTANEMFEQAENTRQGINRMENLITDLSAAKPNRQIVIHMQWLSEEEEAQDYCLYCDGQDLATEKMIEIAEREITELRAQFSYQCAALEKATRNRNNDRKNDSVFERIGALINAEKAV